MGTLMIGVSGVRGIVGESLTPELLIRLGEAFGTYMRGGRVVVGRDTRVSGEMVKHSVLAGLLSTGCSILDVGVCTTPSCTIMIERARADGGIVISASHNPIEWNALKFFRSDGIYLNADQARMLLDIYYQGEFVKVGWNGIKSVEIVSNTNEVHLERVLEIVDVERIRRRRFKVALDSGNGAGVEVTTRLLEELGCETVKIHCTPDGLFPRNPEPTFVNLGDLCRLAKRMKVDVGFAQDADADRIAIVSEKGQFIGEEYSLGLAAEHVLGKRKGPVVTNLSTTKAIDDIAASHGCPVIRTPVGEVHVAERMKEIGSVIGGEGNGGVIDPRVHYGRDSLVGIVLTLELMVETGKSISALVAKLPRYHIFKTKIDCDKAGVYDLLAALRRAHRGRRLDASDGVRIDWRDRWVHIRASNTEPVLRIISEGKTPRIAKELAMRFRAAASAHLGKRGGGRSPG